MLAFFELAFVFVVVVVVMVAFVVVIALYICTFFIENYFDHINKSQLKHSHSLV